MSIDKTYEICDVLPHSVPYVQGTDFGQSTIYPTVATHGIRMVMCQEVLHLGYFHNYFFVELGFSSHKYNSSSAIR